MTSKTDPALEFLTENLFKEALQDSESNQNSVIIKNLDIVQDLSGGNYCSHIYRVSVAFTTTKRDAEAATEDQSDDVKTIRLFVKILYEKLSEISNEYFMYKEVLPQMEAYLRDIRIDYANLSPRVYLSRKTIKEVHIFEDMNARGYKICDRLVGFNRIQSELLLRKLGQYHAASMIYKEKHPEMVRKLNEFYVKTDSSFMTFLVDIMKDNIEYIGGIIENWSEEYREIAEKLRRNVGDEFKRKFLEILDNKDCKVRVLAHGDLWIKNVLILEDDDKVLDAVFIDYQNCFDGSPALDINNIMMSSCSMDVVKNHRHDLIEAYYKGLSETLAKCNYPIPQIPSKSDIVDEVRRTEYFTFYVLIFPFTQTNLSEELNKGMDFAGFFDAERMERNRKDIFSNQRVLETLKFELKRLNDLGVLD